MLTNGETWRTPADPQGPLGEGETKDDLKEAKGTLATLRAETSEAAKNNSSLIANLESNLKEAKGTIDSVRASATEAVKKNTCLIADLQSDLKEAKGTIATLQTELDVALAQNSKNVTD